MTTVAPEQVVTPEADPRRWLTLGVVVMALIIVALDNTILTVAIPTILRDFHTELPSLQWVLTGYSLTFATLLIIGGRLGDIYGARRMFILGAALFGVGSLLASVATSVPTLLVGESLIEGIGASLMLPATLAILSNTFTGRERGTGVRGVGRGRRRERGLRTGRRRIPDHELLVALVVPHQRRHRADRDRRRAVVHASDPARRTSSTHRRRRRAVRRVRHVPARVRTQ